MKVQLPCVPLSVAGENSIYASDTHNTCIYLYIQWKLARMVACGNYWLHQRLFSFPSLNLRKRRSFMLYLIEDDMIKPINGPVIQSRYSVDDRQKNFFWGGGGEILS
jgi:hypothetical protein